MDLGGDSDLQSFEDEQLVVRMTDAAAMERHQQVQRMLSKQLDTTGSLEDRLHQGKSFTKGSVVKSVTDHTRGQLSLEEFVTIQQEHCTIYELRERGLTDDEIAFKLQQEGKTFNVLQPLKRGNVTAEPTIQCKRLKAVNMLIDQQSSEEPGCSYYEEDQDWNPTPQPRKGIFSQLSISKKFTHPDDPINHLHSIEKDLLKKISSKDTPLYQGCEPKPQGYERTYPEDHDDDRSLPGVEEFDRTNQRDDVLSRTDAKGKDRTSDDVNKASLLCKSLKTAAHHTDKDNSKAHLCTAKKQTAAHHTDKDSSKAHLCTAKEQVTGNLSSDTKESSEVASTNKSHCVRQLQGQVSIITKEEIERNRLTVPEIRQLDRFKNYEPGKPSKILYVKNLSKQVEEDDLVSLFIQFQKEEKPKLVFKLLSGRMRGQAFIHFPDVVTATKALEFVNGYKLKGKPVVVQYGKQQER